MRIFASDRVSGMMRKLGMKPGEAIEHPWVTKAIANAQRKVESRNFDIRKQLLEYDDVANDQRRAIYTQRNELLDVTDVSETINSIREDVFKATIDAYIPPQSLEEMWDIPGLQERLKNDFDLDMPISEWLDKEPELHEENAARTYSGKRSRSLSAQRRSCGRGDDASLRKRRDAANARLFMERARLRWITCVRVSTCVVMRKRSEAGIQA